MTPERGETAPLADKIKARIRDSGPISVADYMALCLGDPEHGYYIRRDPLGLAGDFITAPEVSQMFGEIIGLWLAHMWEASGRPSPFALIELGPGRGTLMRDAVRAARVLPGFLDAARLHLVETSPVLRARQRETLAAVGQHPVWHGSIDTLPDMPLFLIANEFFDALPIRQYQRQDGTWAERMIGLDDDGRLSFGLGPGRLAATDVPITLGAAQDGAVLEMAPAATAIVSRIAAHLRDRGGAALIIDYGYGRTATGDTLQAVSRHAFADIFTDPGEVDLTAHVNFEALAAAIRAEGAVAHGPIEQGMFLMQLGLAERAQKLATGRDDDTRTTIREAVERLAGPEEMGSLFKVLAATQAGKSAPPFDSD
ncbi:MAG: class I SAM-dependent methyltransferase [Hyphomicrobiales bacterium]|nr:class I SAM-dependent methyltransferase [Hyphomicrobiales bacterium]